MHESTTYEYILDEGRAEGRAQGLAEGLRRALLRLGRNRFGAPDAAAEAALQAITDPARLERMSDRFHEVNTWKELLDTP